MTDLLLAPAGARVAASLGAALVGILVVERRHLRDLARRSLFLRWRTWSVAAPLFLVAVAHPVGAVAFVAALSVQGCREYADLVGLPRGYRRGLLAAAAVNAPLAVWSLTVWRAWPPVLLLAATLTPLVAQDVRRGLRHLAAAALGFAWVPWLLTYVLLIRQHLDGGPGLLLALGMAVAASDVCAFVIGKALGGAPLAPRLSPAKTRAGVAGNVVGAYAGFGLMAFALPAGLSPVVAWTLPAVVAVGCVWGDLLESLVKRAVGVKDTGDWLPGFGGLLDRIDSLIVTAPLVYTVVVVAT